MQFGKSPSWIALAVVGVSLTAGAALSTAVAAAYMSEDKKIQDEKKLEKKKTIKVISSGKPIIIERKKGRYTVGGHDHESDDQSRRHEHVHDGVRTYRYIIDGKHHSDAEDDSYAHGLARIEEALEQVNTRLKKTKRKSERRVLEAARDGLTTAIDTLKAQNRSVYRVFGHSRGHGGSHVEILDEVRGSLAEVLGDVELEIDLDGDPRRLRIESFLHGRHEMEGTEEERLEAIKRAEKELQKARERLERRLTEKKKSGADENR